MRKSIYFMFTLLFLLQLGSFLTDLEFLIAIVTSIYMPVCFILFFRRIDIFEQETWRDIVSVFLTSCITIMIYSFFIPFVYSMFETLGDEVDASFFDMLFGVAIPEELIKIIPVLIALKLTKFINEPIDYIIYSSISALGFAFIENIEYIYLYQEEDLNIIAVRSFFPTLMHMCTTSIIGVQLYKFYKKQQKQTVKSYDFLYIILAFFISALLHTAYNLEDGVYTLFALSLYYSICIKKTLKDSQFMDYNKIEKELSMETSVTNSGNFKILFFMTIGVLVMDLIFGYMHHGHFNYDMFQNLQFIIAIFMFIGAGALNKDDIKEIYHKYSRR